MPLPMHVTFRCFHLLSTFLWQDFFMPPTHASVLQPLPLLSPTKYCCPSGHWQRPPQPPTPTAFSSILFRPILMNSSNLCIECIY